MKTAISMPNRLFRQVEEYTRRVKKSRSRLLSEAMQEYLYRHSPNEVMEAMNRVCGEMSEPLDPFLQEAGRRRLKTSSW